MSLTKIYLQYFIVTSAIGASVIWYVSSKQNKVQVKSPEWLDKYLKDNNFVKSTRYEKYKQLAKQRGTFFDTAVLSQMNAFNHFGFYRKDTSSNIYCIFSSKDKLSFHRQIMHGGATATLIDTSFTLQAAVILTSLVSTAKLQIMYKRPLFTNQFYLIDPKSKRLNLEANIKKIVQQNQDKQKILVLATAEMVGVQWDDTSEGERSMKNIMQNILKKPVPIQNSTK